VSRDIERAERLAAEIDELLAELVQIVRDVPRVGGRRHWVFTEPCGCAFGVQDAGDAGGGNTERAEAWASFYEDRLSDGFAAMERGVKLILADHDYYLANFQPHLAAEYECPHQGGTG